MPCPSCSSASLDAYGRCPFCGYPGGGVPTGPYPTAYPPAYAAPAAPAGIGSAAQILIAISGLLSFIAMGTIVYGFTVSQSVLRDGYSEHLDQQASLATGIIGVMSVLILVLNLATGIVFIIWFHRAAKLSAILAPGRQPLRQGWAIGGWFVPFAYLVLPRLVMGGIWRASEPLRDQPVLRKPRTVLVTWWWIVFALAQVGVSSGLLTLSTPDTAEDHSRAYVTALFVLALLVALLRIASAVLGVIMLRRVTSRQQVRILQGPGAGHPFSAVAPGYAPGYGAGYAVPGAYAPGSYAPQPYAQPGSQPPAYVPTQAPAEAPAPAVPQDAVPEHAATAVDLDKPAADA